MFESEFECCNSRLAIVSIWKKFKFKYECDVYYALLKGNVEDKNER